MRASRHHIPASLFLLVLAAACGGDYGTNPGGGGGGGGGTTPNVQVQNNRFSPAATTVAGGTTVTWSWSSGGVSHNVTFDDGVTSSPTQGSGSHSRTFGVAGTFGYRCTLHAGMNGAVTVQ